MMPMAVNFRSKTGSPMKIFRVRGTVIVFTGLISVLVTLKD